mgnify:CR=1 FL=1
MESVAKVLLCIDFINEIVHPSGKLAGKGYASFFEKHNTLANVAEAQKRFRAKGFPVVHVKVGFSPSYAEHPSDSPLFGKARELKAITLGTWGTEFAGQVGPAADERVIVKHRVNAFHATALDLILRTRNIRELYIAGVATDLAVESAARDAHDRDYRVTILSDCCAAANDEDHARSLTVLKKMARVITLNELIL